MIPDGAKKTTSRSYHDSTVDALINIALNEEDLLPRNMAGIRPSTIGATVRDAIMTYAMYHMDYTDVGCCTWLYGGDAPSLEHVSLHARLKPVIIAAEELLDSMPTEEDCVRFLEDTTSIRGNWLYVLNTLDQRLGRTDIREMMDLILPGYLIYANFSEKYEKISNLGVRFVIDDKTLLDAQAGVVPFCVSARSFDILRTTYIPRTAITDAIIYYERGNTTHENLVMELCSELERNQKGDHRIAISSEQLASDLIDQIYAKRSPETTVETKGRNFSCMAFYPRQFQQSNSYADQIDAARSVYRDLLLNSGAAPHHALNFTGVRSRMGRSPDYTDEYPSRAYLFDVLCLAGHGEPVSSRGVTDFLPR